MELLARAGAHPGRPVLAAVMGWPRSASLTETEAEERLYELISDARLPLPRTQPLVLGYRTDLAWPELRLIVEIDDHASHSTRAALARDRTRDVRLANAGWTVLRFTNAQVGLEPWAALAEVSHAVISRLGSGPEPAASAASG
jgi:very-short-patch-repair endonuclease